jgi:hypothetical protein
MAMIEPEEAAMARTPLTMAPTPVIEYTLSRPGNGMPHAAHCLHLLTVRDGLIVAGTVFCGGRWPAWLPAGMEAADA